MPRVSSRPFGLLAVHAMSDTDSYGQIVRSSSIMGGAQAVTYIVKLIQVKVIAVLLGPTGVGIIGLYTSATNVLGRVTEVGLSSSSVREIAVANGRGDPLAVARTIRMLRRLCWATGILGWLASVAFAIPLSRWMFKSDRHAMALAVLGGMLLLTAINGGQLGLLQGLRRIGDIARAQVGAAVLNTAVSIALYVWLGERGIVPALIATAAGSLVFSWWFARGVRVAPAAMHWRDALVVAKPLLGLGAAFMLSGVLTLVVDLYTRGLVSRELGVGDAGIYQAAWALSGAFAGFVIAAMGTDFYPRLTGVIHDHAAATREVNQQTEIGVLLALPGLLFTIAFAKWAVWAFYSAKFAAAAPVLMWMSVGVFGRVVSWPLGYVQLAAGAGAWFAVTETVFLVLQAGLVTWGVRRFGVVGTAYAFVAVYVLYTIAMLWVVNVLIGFSWSTQTVRVLLGSGLSIVVVLVAGDLLPRVPALLAGAVLTAGGAAWSMRELAARLGKVHRFVRVLSRIPGARYITGGRNG